MHRGEAPGRPGRLLPAGLLAVVLTWLVLVPAALAQDEAPAPSAPELADRIPGAVWLLLPLLIVLAVVTAVSLASGDESTAALRRDGGVSRALAARQARDRTDPPSST